MLSGDKASLEVLQATSDPARALPASSQSNCRNIWSWKSLPDLYWILIVVRCGGSRLGYRASPDQLVMERGGHWSCKNSKQKDNWNIIKYYWSYFLALPSGKLPFLWQFLISLKNCLIIKWKIMPRPSPVFYLFEAFSPSLHALSPQSPTPALPNPGGMSAISVQTRWETNFPRNRPLLHNLNIRLVQWPAVHVSAGDEL